MAYPVRNRPVIECHDDVVCILTTAKINDAIPRITCPCAIDPRGEREAKPPADDSGARRGRQVGDRRRPGEGVCAVDGARRSRRQRRGRRGRRGRRRRRGRWWWRCPTPRAHHRDERRCRVRQAAAEPHAIQLSRAEGGVPHQQVLHLAREHRIGRPSALAHVEVGAAHRQREAHRRRRRDARTVPVDLGGPVGVGEARTRLHDRDVRPHVCGEGRPACKDFGALATMKHCVCHRVATVSHDDIIRTRTIAKIDDAIPVCPACHRAIDPRAEREAEPPADDSGARRGPQVGGRRPGEGVRAVDGAWRSRRRRRRRRRGRRRRRR